MAWVECDEVAAFEVALCENALAMEAGWANAHVAETGRSKVFGQHRKRGKFICSID